MNAVRLILAIMNITTTRVTMEMITTLVMSLTIEVGHSNNDVKLRVIIRIIMVITLIIAIKNSTKKQ